MRPLFRLAAFSAAFLLPLTWTAALWWPGEAARSIHPWLCLALGVGGLALSGRWRHAAIGMALLHLLVLPSLSVPTAPPATHPTLRVVSWNAHLINHQHARGLAGLQATDADLIVVTELSAEWAEALTPLTRTHPHTLIQPRTGADGLAIYSRLPLRETQVVEPVPGWQRPILLATVDVEGRPLTLAAIHPAAPRSREHRRWAQGTWGQLQGVDLIVGDFNRTPWNQTLSAFCREEDMALANRWLPTWPSFLPTLPIDQVLLGEELGLHEVRVLSGFGSDHRAIQVDLGPRAARAHPKG